MSKKQTQSNTKAGRNIRSMALNLLLQVMEEGKYCDHALHKMLANTPDISKKERAFLTRLTQGTVERCIEIDYIINYFSKVPVHKMKPAIRGILRLSVYQMKYMDQIPVSAICNEAVKLTAKRKFQGLKGFVNGVLRSIARDLSKVEYPKDKYEYLSVYYSMPQWLVSYFLEEYSYEETERILAGFLTKEFDTTLRCNTYYGNKEKRSIEEQISFVRESLEGQQVTVTPGKLVSEALHITGYDTLPQLEAFQKGMVQVQDESSMIVGKVSGIKPGDMVIDVCAAPGGKSLHAADLLQGDGMILSCDLSEAKVRMIQENMERVGVENCELYRQNARIFRQDWENTADVLIADLPCSGLGVIGGKCDIKYHTKREDFASLTKIQKEILESVSRYVKPGGTLLFSTCTIGKEENENTVVWILEHLPFEAVSIEKELPQALQGGTGKDGYIQILPWHGTDGFFVAKFRHKKEK